MDLVFPLSNPSYFGDEEALKKYFLTNPLNHSKTFRILIGFAINCKGQLGNFLIANEGEGELTTIEEQILEIVKKNAPKMETSNIS
jgi:hypothetical protein